MTLYDIGDELATLDQLLEDIGGDVSDADIEAAFNQWFAEVNDNLAAKVDGYCAVMRNDLSVAETCKVEAARLIERAKGKEAKAERMKARLKTFMESRGIAPVDTPRFGKAYLRGNGGALPLIVNPEWERDAASAPEAYHERKITLNKAAIRADLDAGVKVEGCEIGKQRQSLVISGMKKPKTKE